MHVKSFFFAAAAFTIIFDEEEEDTKGEAPRSELNFYSGSVRHKFFISFIRLGRLHHPPHFSGIRTNKLLAVLLYVK
jgi:hypothetical protein